MSLPKPLHLSLCVAALLDLLPAQDLAVRRFDHENVLGTSFHLELRADAALAPKAEAAALAEIERLSAILSAYDPHSELQQLHAGSAQAASPELRQVLDACEHWRTASGGAFDAGVAVFTLLWQQAGKQQGEPTAAQLDAAKATLGGPLWEVDDARGTVTLRALVPLTLDGLAKGYIIDRAAAATQAAGGKDVLVDIGGDMYVEGTALVGVADPKSPADNAPPLCRLQLHHAAIASSGGYARGFDVGGRHYSHIIDPRTGRPVSGILQSTVVAADAVTADALATILSVMTPDAGLALVATVPHAECMCVDKDGAQHMSPGWSALLADGASGVAATRPAGKASAWPAGCEVAIDFELAGPANSSNGRRGGWRRPYVAVWIEDEVGAPVRTLCLWIERPRWLADLRRWNRLFDRDDNNVAAVTRATRAPGNYHLTWDGSDDSGVQVKPGKYTVLIEAVREHGTYQLLKREVTINGKPFDYKLDGGTEIAGARVSLSKPKNAR